LRHLAVRLFGAVGEGRGRSNFTGTRVITWVEEDRTYVLTAKHNLRVAATDARVAPGESSGYFRRQIKAEFTPINGQVVSGTVESVDVIDGDATANGYDVAVLRVAGRPYANAVRALAAPTLRRTRSPRRTGRRAAP
jgi:hypothetical protein